MSDGRGRRSGNRTSWRRRLPSWRRRKRHDASRPCGGRESSCERSKAELKALMPEDANEAISHSLRAKRWRSAGYGRYSDFERLAWTPWPTLASKGFCVETGSLAILMS